MEYNVLEGTDLILSVGGKALGFSTGCKIDTSTETGERVTKEAAAGKCPGTAGYSGSGCGKRTD